MIDQAAADLAIDPSISYLVGDQSGDIELALSVGATPVLIRSPAREIKSLAAEIEEAEDLWDATRWIIEHARQSMGAEVAR